MSEFNTALTKELLGVFDLQVLQHSKILKLKILKKINFEKEYEQSRSTFNCPSCGKNYETFESLIFGCRGHNAVFQRLTPSEDSISEVQFGKKGNKL